MEKLLSAISNKAKIDPELEEVLQHAFQHQEIANGQLLLKEQQHCRRLYFMDQGLVRTYYSHKDKEVTSWFYPEGHFFTSWYSFYTQFGSMEAIETIEPCSIYYIEYAAHQKMMSRYPNYERFARLLAEEQTAFIDLFSKGYMFLSAKERYERILDYLPDIELRAKLSHLASFLGISQETLSRLRSGR